MGHQGFFMECQKVDWLVITQIDRNQSWYPLPVIQRGMAAMGHCNMETLRGESMDESFIPSGYD